MSTQQNRPPLLGRDEELRLVAEALDRAASGNGALVLLGGEPGIGKSRLADEAAAVARSRGFVTLWGRGWEDAGAPPYWPWVQVFRAYLRQTDAEAARRQLGPSAVDLVSALPELRELFVELPEPANPDTDAARFQLFDSTVSFLRRAGTDRPLLVVLDDLHATDPSSLRLLRFLAGQLSEMRLVVLATYRDVELTPDHPLTHAIADVGREPTTSTLLLGGLDRDALRTLIGTTARVPEPEAFVAALERGTKGNPLYATETLRLLSAEGRLDELAGPSRHLAVPPGVRAVIGRRLERLRQETTALLSLAALLGPEFDADLLGHVAEDGGAGGEAAIDEAVGEKLLVELAGATGRYRFSHDLVRETLYDELPPGRRRALHRRVAERLEELHRANLEPHLAELAYHFYEGERDADGDRRTISYARRAGDRASRSLAFEEAARLYGIALAALDRSTDPAPAERLELLLAIGDTLNRGGDVARAGAALLEASEAARSLGASRELARAALGLGGRLPWARPGREHRLVPLLQDALVHLGGADDRLRVRLLTRLACAWRSSPEERSQSDALSRQAVELARSIGDPAVLSYALAGRFWAVWWPNNPDERLHLAQEMAGIARETNDPERLIDAELMMWLSHTELADMTAARREAAVMFRLVADLRQPGHLWLGIAPRALMALMEGHFDDAERLVAEESDPGSHFTLARDNVSAARFHRFLLRREQGRLAEIEPEVRASLSDFPWYPLHRSALALLLLDLGRTDEARLAVEELATDGFAALYPDNEWLLGVSMAAEAVARLELADAAAVLYGQLAPMAGRHAIGHAEGSVGAVDRYLGLLAAALDRLDDAVGHLEDAVHVNERMGARPWTAHSRHDLADALRLRDAPGDAQRAAELDGIALVAARILGMPVLERRILAASSSASGVPHSGSGTFRREGEYWTIVFEGASVRMKHSKGLGYIARLLAQPGVELHALDLVSAGGGGGRASAARAAAAGLHAGGGDAGPALDDAAKAAYRERAEDLRSELAEAEAWNDPERAARASAELEALASQLAASVGLGGRDRPTSSAGERARVSATRAIRGAMDRMTAELPALAGHLAATLHTGTYCSYTPDPRAPMEWRS